MFDLLQRLRDARAERATHESDDVDCKYWTRDHPWMNWDAQCQVCSPARVAAA